MLGAVCDKSITSTPIPELERLEAQVRIRLGSRVRNLRLLLRDECLVLKGRAHTYYAKQLAQHAVMQVAEYRIHANEIEVVPGEEDAWFKSDL
jgi:hypothetical protein